MEFTAVFALVGFFIGIVLDLFLLSIVVKRLFDRFYLLLTALLMALMFWYAGNFVSLFLRQMEIRRVGLALEVVDTISFVGLALVPAFLLHTHWAYYRRKFVPGPREKKTLSTLIAALYFVQLLLLPWALGGLFQDPDVHPLQKLGYLQLPFLLVLALSYYASSYVQLRIVSRSGNRVEASLFRRLAALFVSIPLFNFWVFEGRGAQLAEGGFWIYSALLASLLPTFLVAYYIYRFQFLQIRVPRTVTSAFLTLAVIVAYLAGIQNFRRYMQDELGAPPLLVEATFLVTLLLFFPTLSDWLQNRFNRGLTAELQSYRRIAEEIGQSDAAILSVEAVQASIEEKLRDELKAETARIHPGLEKPPSEGRFYLLHSGKHRLGYLELSLGEEDSQFSHEEGIHLIAGAIAGALERAQLVETQVQLERELAHKTHLEQLGTMAATVAHNVKNPLSSIKTLLQLQQEADNLTADQKAELRMMTDEVDRLSRTVTSLLRFSRMEKNYADLEKRRVNVSALIESLESVFRGDLEQYRLHLKTRFRTGPALVRGAPERLEEILRNLIKNAIEASPEDGTIVIDVSSDSRRVRIAIEDEGPGIPPEIQEKVQQPFFTTKASGSGLGLAIVRHHVSQLEGEFKIESPVTSRGTRLWLELPLDDTG